MISTYCTILYMVLGQSRSNSAQVHLRKTFEIVHSHWKTRITINIVPCYTCTYGHVIKWKLLSLTRVKIYMCLNKHCVQGVSLFTRVRKHVGHCNKFDYKHVSKWTRVKNCFTLRLVSNKLVYTWLLGHVSQIMFHSLGRATWTFCNAYHVRIWTLWKNVSYRVKLVKDILWSVTRLKKIFFSGTCVTGNIEFRYMSPMNFCSARLVAIWTRVRTNFEQEDTKLFWHVVWHPSKTYTCTIIPIVLHMAKYDTCTMKVIRHDTC